MESKERNLYQTRAWAINQEKNKTLETKKGPIVGLKDICLPSGPPQTGAPWYGNLIPVMLMRSLPELRKTTFDK